MTQFALVSANAGNVHIKPIDEIDNDFLADLASKLLPDVSHDRLFIFFSAGKDIDSLMLDAQTLLNEGARFNETMLYRVVDEVAQVAEEIIFWYGSDHANLECIYDVSALLGKTEEAVSDSACELYVHYIKLG